MSKKLSICLTLFSAFYTITAYTTENINLSISTIHSPLPLEETLHILKANLCDSYTNLSIDPLSRTSITAEENESLLQDVLLNQTRTKIKHIQCSMSEMIDTFTGPLSEDQKRSWQFLYEKCLRDASIAYKDLANKKYQTIDTMCQSLYESINHIGYLKQKVFPIFQDEQPIEMIIHNIVSCIQHIEIFRNQCSNLEIDFVQQLERDSNYLGFFFNPRFLDVFEINKNLSWLHTIFFNLSHTIKKLEELAEILKPGKTALEMRLEST